MSNPANTWGSLPVYQEVRHFAWAVKEMVRYGSWPPPKRPYIALSQAQVAARRSKVSGPIEESYFNHSGRRVNKWIHYLPIYDRALAEFRGKRVTMLEIGVDQGGSLELWRDYFGEGATICGIDANPACATRFDPPNSVRIGSQADPAFLLSVINEIGRPNIILDDGSHVSVHQKITFQTLWPHLQTGGIYIFEDLHTSYWREYQGGFRRKGTAVELVKDLIDDQHGWYHQSKQRLAPPHEIGGITIYDSIAVIEKVNREQPGHFKVGVGVDAEPNRPRTRRLRS